MEAYPAFISDPAKFVKECRILKKVTLFSLFVIENVKFDIRKSLFKIRNFHLKILHWKLEYVFKLLMINLKIFF